MKTVFAALALAACLALTGCFTSEAPLYDARQGAPLFGKGRVLVTTYDKDQAPDTGTLEWTSQGYVEPGKAADGAMSFHHLDGMGWFSPWYVGQTNMGGAGKDGDGYMYLLYKKEGARLLSIEVDCKDLTQDEAQTARLVRRDGDSECVATRPEDLAQAFRLLAKRKPATGYMIAQPAN
jgi:hypothetical protein